MIMGLVPQTPLRLPNAWQHGLLGLGDGIPPVSLCKDAVGNVIDCSTGQPVGGGGVQITPGSGGTVQGTCDPVMVNGGYVCQDNGDGTVTYTYVGAPAVSATVTVPATPGGAGAQGSAAGEGAGTAPAPGGVPPASSSWKVWLLAAAVIVLAAKAVS